MKIKQTKVLTSNRLDHISVAIYTTLQYISCNTLNNSGSSIL